MLDVSSGRIGGSIRLSPDVMNVNESSDLFEFDSHYLIDSTHMFTYIRSVWCWYWFTKLKGFIGTNFCIMQQNKLKWLFSWDNIAVDRIIRLLSPASWNTYSREKSRQIDFFNRLDSFFESNKNIKTKYATFGTPEKNHLRNKEGWLVEKYNQIRTISSPVIHTHVCRISYIWIITVKYWSKAGS